MLAHRVVCGARWLSRVFLALPLALALGFTTGCATTTQRWAEVNMQELGYQNLYASVLDMLEMEGYSVHKRLPDLGEIETEWLRGISRREVRGPSRSRVHVDINRAEGRRHYVVRIRVEEQIVRKGGMLSTGDHRESDWEPFPDNFEDAEYLAAKLRALLSEYAIRDEAIVEPEAYYQ
jgi:hypothetical protein